MSTVRVEARDGTAVLFLDRPKANAIDPQLIGALSAAFREAEESRAVVFTSSLPGMFSAGFDLPLLVEKDRAWMEDFLDSFGDLLRQVFAFGPPVVAALPGHAIAGGLIVAMTADERIAAEGKGKLGLSEVVLGVPVPACALELFRHVIGARAMERLAATGENVSVERALATGLVDAVVPAEELLERALARASTLSAGSSAAHAEIKRRCRSAALARFDQARERDPFLDFWFSKDGRFRIQDLVARLTSRA